MVRRLTIWRDKPSTPWTSAPSPKNLANQKTNRKNKKYRLRAVALLPIQKRPHKQPTRSTSNTTTTNRSQQLLHRRPQAPDGRAAQKDVRQLRKLQELLNLLLSRRTVRTRIERKNRAGFEAPNGFGEGKRRNQKNRGKVWVYLGKPENPVLLVAGLRRVVELMDMTT